MNIETTIERIELLADHMDTVPEDEFNFGRWGCHDFEPGATCGTSGCAIGHATTMPYFRDLGLSLYYDESAGHVYPCLVKDGKRLDLTLKESVMQVFGCSEALFGRLFLPNDFCLRDSSPKEWAAHARK